MSDYTITTDFGAKDSLPSGNAAKIIKGSEFTTEFTNIKTAVNTKADTAGDTFTGAVTFDAAVTLNADVTFDTNTLFVDVSENKVGIGTTSPDTRLHVDGGDVKISSDADLSNGDGKPTIFFSESGADEVYAQISYHGDDVTGTNNFIGIGCIGAVGTTEALMKENHQMVVKASGNVGIGTDSPDALLHVDGGDLKISSDADTSDGDGIPAILFAEEPASSTGVDNAHAAIVYNGDGVSGDNNYVGLGVFDSAIAAEDTLAEAKLATDLNITRGGRVGIGTTSPVNKLHVLNTGTTAISNAVANSGAILDGGTGNIGLNMITPNTGACYINFGDSADSNVGRLVYNHNNNSMTFDTNATERMRIDSSGNVGIGTTSPDSFLTIDKDVSTAYDSSSDDAQRSNTNTLLLKNEDGTANSFAQIAFDLGANDQPIARIAGINTGTSSSALAFVVEGSNVKREAMRIDSSGNVLVGTTDSSVYDSTSGGNTGFVYSPNGFLQVARQTTTSTQSVMNLNKMGADGNIIELYKDGTAVGSISVRNTDNLTIEGNSTHSGLSFGTNELLPFKNGAYIDSTLNIGSTTFKFKDIYRSGSTYSTSDRNKKQDIRDLTDAEARVAVVAKGSLKAFRYIDTVEAEGADANIHFGIIAQDLKAAFEAEGLNADNYQVLKTSTYTDDDGVEQTTYSVCYENLLAFIISAI